MIDRNGNAVRVGWAAHEIVWVEAALSLNVVERMAAFRDIAEMSGRTLCAVQDMAINLRAARKRAQEAMRPVRMALPRSSALTPSAIKPPTLAQLMGGR